MWQCPGCRETVEESFDLCWSCGTGRDGSADPGFERVEADPAVPDPGPAAEVPDAGPPETARAEPDFDDFNVTVTDRPVTVASFWHLHEAWIARGRLEDAGIEAFVADEQLVGMAWIYAAAVGGVKVQVAPADFRRARQTLREDRSGVFRGVGAGRPGPICPECGSVELWVEPYWRRLAFATWLLLGFPLPIRRRTCHCLDCGWTDRGKARLPTQFGIRDLLVLTFIVAVLLSIARTVGFDLARLVQLPVAPGP
jgi:hypothetical protein